MRNTTLGLLIVFSGFLSAQIKEEVATTIKKQTVNVKNKEKKSQSAIPPAVSSGPKEEISYTILDIPADSDFKPSPLPPNNLKNLPEQSLYKNYVEGGYGNLKHIWLDAFATYELKSKNSMGVRLNHNSTKGLKDYAYNVKTNWSESRGEVFFESPLKQGKFHTDFALGQKKYNLFGSSFPEYFYNENNSTNVQQRLSTIGAKANYETFDNKFFNRLSLKINYLKDDFDNRELSFVAKAALDKTGYEADIFNKNFDFGAEVPIHLSYTGSTFNVDETQKYNYLRFGVAPAAKLLGKHYNMKIGVKIDYLNSNIKEYSKFYLFPKLEFEYAGFNSFKAFVGVDGNLEMNSYESLLNEIPYLYPNEQLLPTENRYNIYGGVKGTIGDNFLYYTTISYKNTGNILFYQKKKDVIAPSALAYNKFNTLEANYDDGTIVGFKGSIQYVKIQNLNIGAIIEYNGYSLDNYDKILNRPNFQAQLNAKAKIMDDQLSLGTQVFFIGSRITNDFSGNTDVTFPTLTESTRTLDAYFDFNINAEYRLNSYLNVFLKGINVLNAQNELYPNYPIQGFQVLGGVLFKF